jgi:hypothetical protein
MSVFHKTDRSGRTKNEIKGKRMRKAMGLPQGVGFSVPVPYQLLTSSAWLQMPHQCRLLIDGLMAEHASHNGLENGNLIAPYDMLEARGMRRGNILDAIFTTEALGLIEVVRGVRSYGSRKAPSRYRLTWIGTPDGLTPTNEWRAIKTDDEAAARIRNAEERLLRERTTKTARRAEYAARRNGQSRAA